MIWKIVLVTGIIFQSLITSAQTQWNLLDSLYGCEARDFTIDSKGRIYLCTSMSTLYYSDNNGSNWIKVPSLYMRSVFVGKNDIIYALANGTNVYSGVSVTALAIVGQQPSQSYLRLLRQLSNGKLIAVGGVSTLKVYLSTDNGATWNERYEFKNNGPSDISDFRVNSSDQIFIGTSYGLFRSDDEAITFNKKDNGVTFEGVGGQGEVISVTTDSHGYLYRATATSVYKSVNNGESWSSINFNLPNFNFTNGWIYGGLAITANNTLYLLSQIDGKMFKLDENGTAWQAVSTFGVSYEYDRQLYYNPITSTFFYPSGKSGLFKSLDGGVTWSYADNGIHETGFNDIFKRENNDLLVLGVYGYKKYTNGIWSRRYFIHST